MCKSWNCIINFVQTPCILHNTSKDYTEKSNNEPNVQRLHNTPLGKYPPLNYSFSILAFDPYVLILILKCHIALAPKFYVTYVKQGATIILLILTNPKKCSIDDNNL